jgi:hypothetical protein
VALLARGGRAGSGGHGDRGAHQHARRSGAVVPADAEAEIVASRRELERRLHISVDSFAYPFGHVSSTALAIVERQFRAACTTVLKRVAKEEAHLLPRIDMYYVRSCERLAQLLAGRLDRYLTMRRWGRHARRLLVSDARGH